MNYAREIWTTKEISFALIINCLTLEKHFIICIYVAFFFLKRAHFSIAPRKHTSNNYFKFLLELSSLWKSFFDLPRNQSAFKDLLIIVKGGIKNV